MKNVNFIKDGEVIKIKGAKYELIIKRKRL